MVQLTPDLPGYEIVSAGLADRLSGQETIASLLVEMAAPRLRSLGLDVGGDRSDRAGLEAPYRLYEMLLAEAGERGAHSRYNALVARIVSFARAAEHATAG